MNDDLEVSAKPTTPKQMPDEGWHQAVCSQIHNVGYQKFGQEVSMYPQVVILFELDQEIKEGDYAGKRFTLSFKASMTISEKANLRKFLKSWRSKDFTPVELEKFSLRILAGINAQINVIHEQGKDGVVRPKIGSIGPMPKGAEAMKPTLTDTPKWVSEMKVKAVQRPGQSLDAHAPDPADDLPF